MIFTSLKAGPTLRLQNTQRCGETVFVVTGYQEKGEMQRINKTRLKLDGRPPSVEVGCGQISWPDGTFLTTIYFRYAAEEACIMKGGHLASVSDAFNNSFLQGQAAGWASSDMWLGGSEDETDESWTWTDGTSFDYTNWAIGRAFANSSGKCKSK